MKIPGRKSKVCKSRETFERKVSKGKIACQRMMVKFAFFLQEKSKSVSIAGLRVILVMFCLGWGGLNTYLIWKSFDPENRTIINFQRILLPKNYLKTGERFRTLPSPLAPEKSRVQSFIDSMNTLKGSKQGSLIYDSILRTRPQLMDSIRRFEELQSK